MVARKGISHTNLEMRISEVKLLKTCASSDEFYAKYIQAFVKDMTKIPLTRMTSLWSTRATLFSKLPDMEAALARENSTVMVPAQIKHKSDIEKVSAFADDAIMVKIHNNLALLVQLQREANDVHTKQYELFNSRLDATVAAKVEKALKEYKCPKCETEAENERKRMSENIKRNAERGNVSAG
jgi:hypothetical protein